MFKDCASFIKDKQILELAPSHCLFTEKMLELGAAKIDLIEKDPSVIKSASEYFSDEKKVRIINDDVHFALPKLLPRYETVICAGLLYHSPHPFWILESIANLSPKNVLIDTACSHTEDAELVPEEVNRPGHRQVDGVHCGVSLRLTPTQLMMVMKNLGYKPVSQLNQNAPVIDHHLTEEQIRILKAWSYTFSFWFEKI